MSRVRPTDEPVTSAIQDSPQIADNEVVVAALFFILLASSLLWATAFAAVVAGRLRCSRDPARLRGVRRLTAATPRPRRLRLATDRRRRRRWSRIEALRLIAETSILSPAERDALAGALADRSEDVRLGALAAVSARADGLAAELLVMALVDWRTGRARVAAELERQPGRHVAPLLEGLLADDRPEVRFWALQVIGRSRLPLPWASIAELLHDSSPNVRAALAEGLPAFYPRPTIALLSLLADDEWYVRMHAARALGEARVTRTAPAIAELLRDPSWWVRDAAEKALVALGRAGVREALRLLEDGDSFARDSAAEVLQESGFLDGCVRAAALGDAAAHVMLVKVRSAAGEALVDSAVARLLPRDEGPVRNDAVHEQRLDDAGREHKLSDMEYERRVAVAS
jgi:HEAT repeat protein